MTNSENSINTRELGIEDFLIKYAGDGTNSTPQISMISNGLLRRVVGINNLADLQEKTKNFSNFDYISEVKNVDKINLAFVKKACYKYADEQGIEIIANTEIKIEDFLRDHAPKYVDQRAVRPPDLVMIKNRLAQQGVLTFEQIKPEHITNISKNEFSQIVLSEAVKNYKASIGATEEFHMISGEANKVSEITPNSLIREFIDKFAGDEVGDVTKRLIIKLLTSDRVNNVADLFKITEGGENFTNHSFMMLSLGEKTRPIVENACKQYIEQGGIVPEFNRHYLEIGSFLEQYSGIEDKKSLTTAANNLRGIGIRSFTDLFEVTDGLSNLNIETLNKKIKTGSVSRKVLEAACDNYLARDFVESLMPNVQDRVLQSVTATKIEKGMLLDFGDRDTLFSQFSGKLKTVIQTKKIEGGEPDYQDNSVFIPEDLLKNLREILPELKQQNSIQKGS